MASKRLKTLRERSKLSVQDLADRLALPKSTYASKEDKYKKGNFPIEFVTQLLPILTGLGDPPITAREVWELAGISEKTLKTIATRATAPKVDATSIRQPPDMPGTPLEGESRAAIPEINIRAGMGGGGESLVMAHTDEFGNSVSVDDVKAVWNLPSDYVRHELRVSPRDSRIIEVKGDSMSPTLESGDRVMIDTLDRTPSPGGLFALWDGLGVIVKRLEHVLNSDPPLIRIKSDNPRHDQYERVMDEINIIGRVVWFARRV
ncbi:S24 family peptidase [Telmatospirillum siberiense]|uniref:S24 family peptidase n=1 Tax=Telmatospirillum siberiense TaxID=382514 RepID=UPI00130477FC|nr:S24 family peptidase [Telmatospirillum siberiense]